LDFLGSPGAFFRADAQKTDNRYSGIHNESVQTDRNTEQIGTSSYGT